MTSGTGTLEHWSCVGLGVGVWASPVLMCARAIINGPMACSSGAATHTRARCALRAAWTRTDLAAGRRRARACDSGAVQQRRRADDLGLVRGTCVRCVRARVRARTARAPCAFACAQVSRRAGCAHLPTKSTAAAAVAPRPAGDKLRRSAGTHTHSKVNWPHRPAQACALCVCVCALCAQCAARARIVLCAPQMCAAAGAAGGARVARARRRPWCPRPAGRPSCKPGPMVQQCARAPPPAGATASTRTLEPYGRRAGVVVLVAGARRLPAAGWPRWRRLRRSPAHSIGRPDEADFFVFCFGQAQGDSLCKVRRRFRIKAADVRHRARALIALSGFVRAPDEARGPFATRRPASRPGQARAPGKRRKAQGAAAVGRHEQIRRGRRRRRRRRRRREPSAWRPRRLAPRQGSNWCKLHQCQSHQLLNGGGRRPTCTLMMPVATVAH